MENALNEVQEHAAAITARLVVDDILSGNLSTWDRRMLPGTFKMMGFTHAQAADMMAGNQPGRIWLTQFERKAANFLTGGNRAIAEGSRIGGNRLFNSIFRFQSYPMTKMNQLRKVLFNMVDAWETGKNLDEKMAGIEMFSRFVAGNAIQGIITVGVVAMAQEWLTGAKIKRNEAEDQPLRFLTEVTLASMSGPLYLAWRGVREKNKMGSLADQAGRIIFPYSIMRDFADMASGQGQYHDLDWQETIGKFILNKTPGTRSIRLGMAMAGLSKSNYKTDAAIKGFQRWRRDTLGFSAQQDFIEDDERRDFRVLMKQGVRALKDGKFGEFERTLIRAELAAIREPQHGEKEPNEELRVKASLRARKILKTPDGFPLIDKEGNDAEPILMNSLRKRIGNEAVNRIVYFDHLLESIAEDR